MKEPKTTPLLEQIANLGERLEKVETIVDALCEERVDDYHNVSTLPPNQYRTPGTVSKEHYVVRSVTGADKVFVRVPTERGRWVLTDLAVIEQPCPWCRAVIMEPCKDYRGRYTTGVHGHRSNVLSSIISEDGDDE